MPSRLTLHHRVSLNIFARKFQTCRSTTRQASARVAASGRAPPQKNTTDAYYRQRRTEWVIVGVAGSAAAFGTWYYWSNMRSRTSGTETSMRNFSLSGRSSSFTIPSRSRDSGQPSYKVITPLTSEQVNARLRENERSTYVDRPPGACLVARYDTNTVASNYPIEDKHAEVIVERDRGINEQRKPTQQNASKEDSVRGDLCFFTVMDGHGGDYTSTMLSRKLIAFVALELDKVFKETGEYAQIARSQVSMSSSIWRSVFGGNPTRESHWLAAHALDGNPDIVKRALTKGFRGLDKEIITTPLELLKQYELNLASLPKSKTRDDNNSLSALAHSIWPSTLGNPKSAPFSTVSQSTAYESILPALSGSCALMVYVDSARRDLYVASTGDSRAVAGYWDERAGRWEVEPLSVDQTGRNLDEVKRIQREHPVEEAPYVIQRGRVLGGLEPTRAFGDARYKWDEGTQKRIAEAFLPQGRVRLPPRGLKTPPYVTAEPVVEWRWIPENMDGAMDGANHDNGSGAPSRELRFIIMASDGLWDLMTNEEAVSLVAGHLAGMRGSVRAADLQRMCFEHSKSTAPQAGQSMASVEDMTPSAPESKEPTAPHHPLLKSPHQMPAFTFEDDNLSTHLVRNALGGAARERVAGLLAIPSPESRRYRDDITVKYVSFYGSTHHQRHLIPYQQQQSGHTALLQRCISTGHGRPEFDSKAVD